MAENEAQAQEFSIQRMYLKDMSFETPAGAEIFKQQWQPQIQLDVNTRHEKLEDNIFEVVLTLTVTAKLEEQTGFLIEIQQAGIFLCRGLEDAQLRQVLSTVAPNILFPYARETIDSLAVKGSFPALMLAPINFDALYQQALQQAQQQEEQGEAKH
ncbi:Protein-export protein SecB [BD1-7 clade bacterium]|uniref:Protein-export protein SecB n=1 Tax=BD1-7 clade bacterium TaxID=2029982 RepID=A0A5S9N932_9GAMM|nr:Protein-export protein SecB [BD1-7 clade bacterium]CAA0082158.1 Protein-export protein SecB [BD1-7 clade bacterium]CAA0085470.1 Protein-export protein SecB [BD1-7 clade bacterium]